MKSMPIEGSFPLLLFGALPEGRPKVIFEGEMRGINTEVCCNTR